MKKGTLILIVVLCLLACTAYAETLCPYGMEFSYEVTPFANDVPSAIKSVLAKSVFADDECVSGVMVEQKYDGGHVFRALMAVEHDDVSVLLGISDTVTPLAENFFPKGSVFTVRLIPSDTSEHVSNSAAFFIEHGNRSVGFSLGDFSLDYGMTVDGNGNGWLVYSGPYDGLEVIPVENGLLIPNQGDRWYADIPEAAEYWTFDTYPCTEKEVSVIVSAAPLDAGMFFVNGCNLRTQATGKATSLGKLTSSIPAKPTGYTKPGSQLPWIEISINNITAWVSENYTSSHDSQLRYLMDSASRATPVGRIVQEVSTDGFKFEAGSLVYVVAEGESKLLVCMPEGEMKWRMESGKMIQIDNADVTWAPTMLQLKYKE